MHATLSELLAWPEIGVQFITKYACWLNLIEPWWKQLKSLALKGRRFETLEELTEVLNGAVGWWNEHKHPYYWKKKPQQQPLYKLGPHGSVIENMIKT